MILSQVRTFRCNTENMTQKKNDKLTLINIKNFSTMKDTVKKIKRYATDWEKMFANNISNQEFVLRIDKKTLKSQIIKTTKRVKFLNIYLTKKYVDDK